MNVTSMMTKDYGNLSDWRQEKNKANPKPISERSPAGRRGSERGEGENNGRKYSGAVRPCRVMIYPRFTFRWALRIRRRFFSEGFS
jgi:hypothetical protein